MTDLTIKHSAVPLAFFEGELGPPTWQEVSFGLEHGLLEPRDVIDYAAHRLADGEDSPAVLALAIAEPYEHVDELVRRVIGSGDPSAAGDLAQQTWLLVLVAFSLENVRDTPLLLDAFETLYVDFGYPDAIAGLVRWMPAQHRLLGSREENEAELVAAGIAWRDGERARLRALRGSGSTA